MDTALDRTFSKGLQTTREHWILRIVVIGGKRVWRDGNYDSPIPGSSPAASGGRKHVQGCIVQTPSGMPRLQLR